MPTNGDDFKDAIWIITRSGRRFYLYGDDPDELNIGDIAWATGMIVRFTGHVSRFYSVAEHQVLVSRILEAWNMPKLVQFTGLMHDSTEAYLCDIAAPFKRELQGYHELEDRIYARIAEKYGCLNPQPQEVRLADWTALFIEAYWLLDADMTEWFGWQDHGPATEFFMRRNPDIKPVGHNPQSAAELWLERYEVLKP